jgi:hypothetical protein
MSDDTIQGSTPDAPLARDYPSLVMKRVMRMAAEQGYDGVGWTTGQQQADRYREQLLNGVSDLTYHPVNDTLQVGTPSGGQQQLRVPVSQLADTVGRDNARKLLEDVKPGEPPDLSEYHEETAKLRKELDTIPPGDPREPHIFDLLRSWDYVANTPNVTPGHLTVQDLQVGQRGYSQVYDTQLPSAANKIGRQFGARTQDIDLALPRSNANPNPRGYTEPIHYIPVTPTLRTSALTKGFPLFTQIGAAAAGGAAAKSFKDQMDQRRKSQQAATIH